MKSATRTILSISILTISALAFDDPVPGGAAQAESLEPRAGKPGTILTVKGKYLAKPSVDEVYLTDHRFDLKVKVLEQTGEILKLRVPPFVKPGRLQLLFLTGGKNPVFLEQPFYIQIEDGEEAPTPAVAPVEVTKNGTGAPGTTAPKPNPKTVEIASTGTNIPVPPAPAPAPMTSATPVKASFTSPVESKSSKQVSEVKATKPPSEKDKKASKQQPVQVATVITPVPTPPAVPETVQQQPKQQVPAPTPAPGNTTTLPSTSAPTPAGTNTPAVGITEAPKITPAQLIRRTSMSYPPAARSARIEGTVELVAVVKANGQVKDVKILKGNPYLAPHAANSVRLWLYEPATMNGKPIESEVNITLNFKRPD